MITINFDPLKLTGDQRTWWETWSATAIKATDKAIDEWERSEGTKLPELKDSIWGDLKHWLLENVFNGKCAYCETHIGMSRAPGHAEHFRPKGGIKNIDPKSSKLVKAKTKNRDGTEIIHPGYFWLAYNWKNLVPSCHSCNTGQGKNNQFPAKNQHILLKKLTAEQVKKLGTVHQTPLASPKWDGFYYLDPDNLDEEEVRLLLHPYKDSPRDHIFFGFKGIEAVREIHGSPSEMGKESIRVFELNNGDLRRARQDRQNAAKSYFLISFMAAMDGGCSPADAIKQAEAQFRINYSESSPYFAAVDDYLLEIKQAIGST